MIIKSVLFKCDIDSCNEKCDEKVHKISVVFTTDQTEGRSTKPYLYDAELNLCEKHLNKLFKGNMIFACGAMGHNNYYFKS